MILLFLFSISSGCLSHEEGEIAEHEKETASLLIYSERESIIGDFLPQQMSLTQSNALEQLIRNHRMLDYNITEIPREGGNWTHYFVCSGGEKIDYVFPMPDEFSCAKSDEKMSGEQYESAWIAFRHREIIRELGLNSGLAYHLTGDVSDGQLAKNILLEYSSFYADLPIQDRFGKQGEFGGKLTRQSLDEAVLLTELAWTHYLIKPILTHEQNLTITSGLIAPMVDVLNTPTNQNRNPLSNWFSFHNAALGMAAVSTNNSSLMEISLTQSNGLYFQLENGFDEDGFWHEGSIAYHNYTLTAMAMCIEAAKYFMIDIETYSWEKKSGATMSIKDPFIAHLSLVKPDGTFPRLNDDILGSDLSSVLDLLEFTNRYWPSAVPSKPLKQAREMSKSISIKSALWMTEPNDSVSELTSLNFEVAGLSIIRQGGIYLLVDYGPHGGGHGHFDKLNVEISSGNSTLLEDPGTVAYSLPSSKNWYRTSLAHSLPFIDMKNQPETTGKLMHYDFTDNLSSLMVQYTDETAGMSVTRMLLVYNSEEYGTLILDASRWEGVAPKIATQTFHFLEAEPIYGDSDSNSLNLSQEIESYVDVRRWDSITDNESGNVLQFTSGSEWKTLVHVMQGNELHSGTSINGGALIIQSNLEPSANSTMFALHRYSGLNNTISFEISSLNNSSIVNIGSSKIHIDWSDYDLFVEQV